MLPIIRRGTHLRRLPKRVLALLTSRSLVVISSTCVILCGVFWGVGALHASSLIPTTIGGVLTNPLPSQTSALPNSSPQPSGLTLEVQASGPVQPWVLNALGEGAGVNPETGLVLLRTPGATYSGVGTNPQLVDVPNASGDYHILLSAIAGGQFDLHVLLYPGSDATKARQYAGSGQVPSNSTWDCDVSITPGAAGAEAKLNVSSIRNQSSSTHAQ